MKPWQLGDGDNTVQTPELRMEFIYDRINNELLAAGINDPTTFAAFATYLGYGSGGCTYQDMQVAWTPTSAKLGEIIFFSSYGSNTSITSIVNSIEHSLEGIAWNNDTVLQSMSFPNLLDAAAMFDVSGNSALTDLSAPALQTVSGDFTINANALTSMVFDALQTVTGNFNASNNASSVLSMAALVTVTGDFTASNSGLVTVNLPNFLPTNGKTIGLNGNALSAASVNQVLARAVANPGYVSGGINLTLGTNAAPTGQGIIDKATLNGRQAGLALTN